MAEHTHTPVPWELSGPAALEWGLEPNAADQTDFDFQEIHGADGDLVALVAGKGNAELILRAGNAHDDLLAALEVAERFMAAWLADHSMEEWPLDKYEAIEIARAAIARAKEGV